jgi:CRP/FNR family transcriptional regulator, cyclic AMP receptor protein
VHIIDSKARSASVSAIGKTISLAVNTTAKNRLSAYPTEEDKLDFILLLYRVFAEYMSIRLRATNDELIASKKKSGTRSQKYNCFTDAY